MPLGQRVAVQGTATRRPKNTAKIGVGSIKVIYFTRVTETLALDLIPSSRSITEEGEIGPASARYETIEKNEAKN